MDTPRNNRRLRVLIKRYRRDNTSDAGVLAVIKQPFKHNNVLMNMNERLPRTKAWMHFGTCRRQHNISVNGTPEQRAAWRTEESRYPCRAPNEHRVYSPRAPRRAPRAAPFAYLWEPPSTGRIGAIGNTTVANAAVVIL